MKLDLTDASVQNLKGTVVSTISKGKLDSKYLTKAYKFKSEMPTTKFNSKTYTTIDKNIVETKVDFNSNLANLDVAKAVFDIEKGSLKSDYKLNVANLNNLYFVTQRNLKGDAILVGDIKKDKDLDFTMKTNMAGGVINAKLHNDDLYAKLNSLDTLDILDMLLYPKILKSKIDGDLKYNLVASKGVFKAKLTEGRFTKNQILDLTKQYAHRDLYKEKFVGDVNANINKEHIVTNLSLKSNKSSITTKGTKLNTKTNTINSKLDIVANKHPLVIYLKGDVNSPSVKIDADEIIKKEAGKAIDKQINKLFKKLF
jgi:hypothetical protein